MVAEIKHMNTSINDSVDCACVIHGNTYDWIYVEKLYNMLCRHISLEVRLHVYTEESRPVPAPMIKHTLNDWGISGPKQAWWYKMQLFDTSHHAGPLLYLDLDTVIVGNIDWIFGLPSKWFWSINDFKHLWRPHFQGINSSVMWWDTRNHESVWRDFVQKNLKQIMGQNRGDQDYLNQCLDFRFVRFFDQNLIKSWRWQCLDGGYDFKKRSYRRPNTGTDLDENTRIMIFHGKPKPLECTDPVILTHWR